MQPWPTTVQLIGHGSPSLWVGKEPCVPVPQHLRRGWSQGAQPCLPALPHQAGGKVVNMAFGCIQECICREAGLLPRQTRVWPSTAGRALSCVLSRSGRRGGPVPEPPSCGGPAAPTPTN